MLLNNQIQSTLAALNAIQLARQRLAKLQERQFDLEDRIFDIQESLELEEEYLSQSGSEKVLQKARSRYLQLVLEQKELSEKQSILLFEKEILTEKIAGEVQLKIKLKALMNMRVQQLEGLPKNARVAITQINKDLDGALTIKGELDQIIQISYRLRVKLTDIHDKLSGMTLWNRLKSALDLEYRKSINEIHNQIMLSTRLTIEFEDTLEQLNRLQTKTKFFSSLSRNPITIRHQPLSREWLTADVINHAISILNRKIAELDDLITDFKSERIETVRLINKLERQRKGFLLGS